MEMKNGTKTTEFWLMIATVAGTAINLLPGPWAIIGAGLYSIARGLAKSGYLKGTAGKVLNN